MYRVFKFIPAAILLLAFSLPNLAIAGHDGGKLPEITDLKVGDGDEAVSYSKVTVHYTGWLMNGSKFDSSLDRDKPFEFTIGMRRVISGWELGVTGMKVGGKRQLIIPPELGYGKKGAGGIIPPNATLKFEIELLAVEGPAFKNIGNDQLKELLAKNIPIIDIRTKPEWPQTGIIEGSKLIVSFQENGRLNPKFLDEFKNTVGKDDPVILICRTGNRSSVLANALANREGYSNIYSVTNGIVDWIKDGNPVVKP